jgi:ubiquinone/menaquinone biosynthesis C-methylase UbiE
MIDYYKIYQTQADQYDALVSYEDHQGHLLPALTEIRSLEAISAVELGAGTGRFTRLLAPYAAHIVAIDISMHMLEVAKRRLMSDGSKNNSLVQADHRFLPIADGQADVAIAGWSFGHLIGWHPDNWHHQIELAVSEMGRILRVGGTAIILETLGTGQRNPAPPTAGLSEYYAYLEDERGFSKKWIRTDYRFPSVSEAEKLTSFFFGEELANRVAKENSAIVPECTGIWWKKF